MKVNREQFLHSLEMVQPGLAQRETIEQSTCVVFKEGELLTYNDEVACRVASGLKDIEGALRAKSLIELLRKLPEDEVDIRQEDDKLWVVGKKRRSYHILEAEIVLPVHYVEKPKTWEKLHRDFCEAVGIVGHCAGTTGQVSNKSMSCVHIHPKWVEASDNIQVCRWKLQTGFSKPTLIRQTALRHVVSSGVTEFSETEGWVHFRNSSGLVISCRRYAEMDYANLTEYMMKQGVQATLPKGLSEAAEKAGIFTAENAAGDNVNIQLRPGKLKITGVGVNGGYEEFKKVQYAGQHLEFLISPKLLQDILKRHSECQLDREWLKIDAGNYRWVVCLQLLNENQTESELSSEEEEEITERLKKKGVVE